MRSPCDADDVGSQGDHLSLAITTAGLLVDAVANGANTAHLSDKIREIFTLGACDILATALSDRTGWPIVLVGDGGGRVGWVHAGVRMPSGLILDVDGTHGAADWLTAWAPLVDAYGNDHEEYEPDAVTILSAGDFRAGNGNARWEPIKG